MSSEGRAITVLAGGREGKVFEDDLDLERNYSISNSAGHFATMLTLSSDRFAEQHPEQSFIHGFPGLVSTGLLGRSATGVLGGFFREQHSGGSWSLDGDGTAKNIGALD
ncbi:hypothetical protein LTR37_016734 [Vermiconidia calcicola]|uniref:Uncharacterized protein n=1 Tax=Vermiconidia calcicola TaxID=1690605 RepID=A0ACC3MNM7_9PEZI|nr:hypothetical protein LTR37_016734 [Vermiconidia calcicola]